MSDTPGADLLNGGEGGRAWAFRLVTMFRKVHGPFERSHRRPTGAGPDSGQPWPTASTLDEATCLSEDLSVVYVDPVGKEHTLSDMIIELYMAAKGFK